MPKRTRRNLRSSARRKSNSCKCGVETIMGAVVLTVKGRVCNGLLLLQPHSTEEECEEQARLAAEVARNTCLLNGGTEQECQAVYDQTYQQVYAECTGSG